MQKPIFLIHVVIGKLFDVFPFVSPTLHHMAPAKSPLGVLRPDVVEEGDEGTCGGGDGDGCGDR